MAQPEAASSIKVLAIRLGGGRGSAAGAAAQPAGSAAESELRGSSHKARAPLQPLARIARPPAAGARGPRRARDRGRGACV